MPSLSQAHTILSLVSAGIGLTLVPEAARKLGVHGVTLRELRPAPKTCAELHLAWQRGLDDPAFHSFCGLVLPKLLEDDQTEMRVP